MISYCITVYNEVAEMTRLFANLNAVKKIDDEIVVIQTYRNESEKDTEWYQRIHKMCELYATTHDTFHFTNNFADMKNFMSGHASKKNKYIINFDADETMDTSMLYALRAFLQHTDTDIFYVPRANIVNGLTEEDIKKWSWNTNRFGWVNWPDFQSRIYKINSNIRWVGNVHEHLEGFGSSQFIEPDGSIFISHVKDIEKQRQQNDYYETI